MNFFPQKRDLLTVKVNQFWIVEEKPVKRNTCTLKGATKKQNIDEDNFLTY